MASLHIKNIGPILDSTKIELTPLMVLISRQSSSKSTFMKVLCFCRWVEKKLWPLENRYNSRSPVFL